MIAKCLAITHNPRSEDRILSQVVVTHDSLIAKREKSRAQEKSIDRTGQFSHWLKSDIYSRKNPFMVILGVVFIPIAAFWALLLVGIGFAVSLVSLLMATGARLFGKK